MKNYFLLIIALSVALSGTAQTSAEDALNILRNHTLIVKLIVPEKKMEALLKANKKEEMLAVQKETERLHENLIQAFSTTYTFGKVAFIYSTEMYRLAEGDASALFDAQGSPLEKLPTTWLFIELSESPQRSINGFVVRDKEHYVLSPPFPYFVSQWGFLHLSTRSFPSMIIEWQDKLNRFALRL